MVGTTSSALGSLRLRSLLVVLGAGCLLSACGSSEDSASSSSPAPAAAAAGPVKCGLGNGKKASGDPIRIGAIGTKVPGLDFTAAPLAAQAYFACVNENGGINGRPVKYTLYDDALAPPLTASLASKLIQTDKVDAMVGSASINECGPPAAFLAQNGITADISMGLPQNCFETPNIAPVNSAANTTLGLAAVMVEHGAKTIVVGINAGPNIDATIKRPFESWGQKTGIKTKIFIQPAPVANPNALAVRLGQAAGADGGVVLSFDPADELAIMKAVQQQGLGAKGQWGSSSQAASDSFAKSLGDFWQDKFLVADEFALPTSPAAATYRAVEAKYGKGAELSVVAENGFVAAEIATQTMLKLPAAKLTRAGINAALKQVKAFKSPLYCTPYFFGDLQYHMSNYMIRTDTPKDGKLAEKYGCSEIPATPANHIDEIKAYAQANGS